MTNRQDCDAVVNLIDLYPTLIKYCGLPEKKQLDGRSFVPLLESPTTQWNDPTVTIFGVGNASIQDDRWHYVRHKDGTEEFYDVLNDPMEWENRIRNMNAEESRAKDRLAALYPDRFADPVQCGHDGGHALCL